MFSIQIYLSIILYFFLIIPTTFSQEGSTILSVRGKIGNEILYHFAGTVEDIVAQCEGGYILMQNSIAYLETDQIPFWTANDNTFNPPSPVKHTVACESIVASAEANEMARLDAQFHIKGVIDDEFAYDFTGNFAEVLELATQWLTENNIDFAFMISADGWDGNTYTFETPLIWTKESMAAIMRAFSIYVEPAKISTWEIY